MSIITQDVEDQLRTDLEANGVSKSDADMIVEWLSCTPALRFEPTPHYEDDKERIEELWSEVFEELVAPELDDSIVEPIRAEMTETILSAVEEDVQAKQTEREARPAAALGSCDPFQTIDKPVTPSDYPHLLQFPDRPILRYEVASTIAEIVDEYPEVAEASIDPLANIVSTADKPRLKRAAIRALANIARVAPVSLARNSEPIVNAVNDDDSVIRSEAIWIFRLLVRDMGERAATEVAGLTSVLGDCVRDRYENHPEVRTLAAKTLADLAQVAPRSVIPAVLPLFHALEDEFNPVRRHAYIAIDAVDNSDVRTGRMLDLPTDLSPPVEYTGEDSMDRQNSNGHSNNMNSVVNEEDEMDGDSDRDENPPEIGQEKKSLIWTKGLAGLFIKWRRVSPFETPNVTKLAATDSDDQTAEADLNSNSQEAMINVVCSETPDPNNSSESQTQQITTSLTTPVGEQFLASAGGNQDNELYDIALILQEILEAMVTGQECPFELTGHIESPHDHQRDDGPEFPLLTSEQFLPNWMLEIVFDIEELDTEKIDRENLVVVDQMFQETMKESPSIELEVSDKYPPGEAIESKQLLDDSVLRL